MTWLHNFVTYFAAGCNPEPKMLKQIPTWYKYLDGEKIGGRCAPKFEADKIATELPKLLLGIFDIVLFIGGIVAVVFILYGGFQYLIGQGEPERTKNARSTIINALIGLVITISASAVVQLIGGNL